MTAFPVTSIGSPIRRTRGKTPSLWRTVLSGSFDAIIVVDNDDIVVECNEQAVIMCGVADAAKLAGLELGEILRPREDVEEDEFARPGTTYEVIREDGTRIPVALRSTPIGDENAGRRGSLIVLRDMGERTFERKALQAALTECVQRIAETSTFLENARAIVGCREFAEASEILCASARHCTGARLARAIMIAEGDPTTGAIIYPEGQHYPVHESFLTLARERLERASTTHRALWVNDLRGSAWAKLLPESGQNLLLAPIAIAGNVWGMLALVDKPDGFSQSDSRVAVAFGELASLALLNLSTWDALQNSEKRFRSVVETAGEAIMCLDQEGKVVFWNGAADHLFGYSADEMVGSPVNRLVPGELESLMCELLREIRSGHVIAHSAVETTALKKNGSFVPIELSISSWRGREGRNVTMLVRDLTERKRAEQKLRSANEGLERRVDERTAELAHANETLMHEISERKRAEDELRAAHGELESRVQARTEELASANSDLRVEISERQRAELRITQLLDELRRKNIEPNDGLRHHD